MDRIRSLIRPIAIGLIILLLISTLGLSAFNIYAIVAQPAWLNELFPSGETAETTPEGEGETQPDDHAPTPTPIDGGSHTSVLPVDPEPGKGILYDTGSKVINLADQSGRRYIKVNVVLEFAPDDPNFWLLQDGHVIPEERPAYVSTGGDEEGETVVSAAEMLTTYISEYTAEIDVKKPAIDDKLISVLSSKTFEDIKTSEGKEHLREEIMEEMNHLLEGYHIIAVYFTEFVIQ